MVPNDLAQFNLPAGGHSPAAADQRRGELAPGWKLWGVGPSTRKIRRADREGGGTQLCAWVARPPRNRSAKTNWRQEDHSGEAARKKALPFSKRLSSLSIPTALARGSKPGSPPDGGQPGFAFLWTAFSKKPPRLPPSSNGPRDRIGQPKCWLFGRSQVEVLNLLALSGLRE